MDGASIPAPLWSAVGSPYTGDYRRVSVVHDVACQNPAVPRREADQMFYQTCLAGGCSAGQAELLYAGVRIGAWVPRIRFWAQPPGVSQPRLAQSRTQPVLTAGLPEESMRTTFREIAADLAARPARKSAKSFAAVEAIVDRHLAAKASQ